MAQHDYVIANGTGAAVRSDLNNALAAIVSQNSGATTPSTTYAYQWWADTTTGLLKLRNAANSAWITLFQLDGEWSTIALENGTAAAPSIYFKDSGTDTGFYSPGTDQVGISTGGTARLTIDSNGNVNIDSNTLYVDAANNRVGLGTSSPQAALHVQSQIYVKGTAGTDGQRGIDIASGSSAISTDTHRLRTGGGTGQDLVLETQTATAGLMYLLANSSSGQVIFQTNSAERLRIDSSGRVGIGTTSPLGKTHIQSASTGLAAVNNAGDELVIENNGTTGMTILSSNTSTGTIYFADSDSAQPGAIQYDHTDNFLIFRVNNSERARIDSSGRLLVGTSTSRSVNIPYGSSGQFTSTDPYLFQVESAGFAGASFITNRSADAGGSYLVLGRSRGSSPGGTTIVANGDNLGTVCFNGSDGATLLTGAAIRCDVDGTPGTNDLPSRLVFSTTADGASSPTERFRIGSAGQLGIGGATYGTSGQVLTSNGASAAPSWQNAGGGAGTLRAWVNFNGTGTVAIRASGNVSSITDNGTGDYTVNFTTALPDANYAFIGTSSDDNDDSVGPVAVGMKASTYVPTTTSRRFETTFGGVNFDSVYVSCAIFR